MVGRAIIQYIGAPEGALPTEEPYHPLWNASSEGWVYGKTLNPEAYRDAYTALTTPEEEIKRYVLVPTQVHIIGKDGKQTGLGWAVNNISFAFTSPEPIIGMAVKAANENGWPTEIPGTIHMPQNPPAPWNYTFSDQPNPNVGEVGTSVIQANKGEVVEIIFQNTWDLSGVSDIHQWHIHGHSFWVVGEGPGTFDPDTDPATYNLENPVLRDTVSQWPLGWTALRIKLNNPGVWFCHCHILPHLSMGMAFAFVVQADEIEDYFVEAESVQYCMESDLEQPVDAGSAVSVYTALWLLGCVVLFVG